MKSWLLSLNTHAVGGSGAAILGLVLVLMQPDIAAAIADLVGPTWAKRIKGALVILGGVLAYLGRPKTVSGGES